jgi:CheY-like chemotaxis protein
MITGFSQRVSTGQTLTAVIRSREAWRGLPIINLTADALDDVLEEAIAAGVDVNLIMPVEPAEVLRTVLRLAGARTAVPADGGAF